MRLAKIPTLRKEKWKSKKMEENRIKAKEIKDIKKNREIIKLAE